MKAYWGSGGIVPCILDLGTRWRWVVSFTHRPLYPQGTTRGTHWTGGWVGPRAVLDAVVKRKIPSPRRKSNPRTPIVQPVAQRCTDWAIEILLHVPISHPLRFLCIFFVVPLVCYGYLQLFDSYVGKMPQIGHGRLLSYPLQFIIHDHPIIQRYIAWSWKIVVK
jgi:hypothetical protein